MPLNPELYHRLRDYFGDVEIVAEGQSMTWALIHRAVEGNTTRPARQVISSGEEYRVRCKVCLDHRARLHINHMWGVWDQETESNNLHLIQCFNEQCYDNYDARYRLYEKLFDSFTARRPMQILPGRLGAAAELKPIDPPGHVYPLEELANDHKGHPAVLYLQNRGFDVVRLSRMYGVGYCGHSHFHNASHRIIIPIHQDGMMVGWQARYIGDSVNGVPFNVAKVPKYYTSPGCPRRLVAYNLERALTHKTVIAVEGPADVWRQGPMCVGAIGKTFGTAVRQRIIKALNAWGEEGVLVIALDPKADPSDIRRNRPHHIERLYAQLVPDLGPRIVRVYLPEDHDPGSMDRDSFRRLVKKSAKKEGLAVGFSKPVSE